jgi:short subunit dehydrogenase-like uncharacterized protein
LIYGATGYTGRLIAARARKSRHPLVIAGRNASRIQALSAALGIPGRVFMPEEPDTSYRSLRDISVLINAASPFENTAPRLIDACLRTRTHYLDITGELPSFQDALSRDDVARERGIMIMPGVGLGIVASNCLALHVARLLPNAKYLRIGLSRPGFISRGTLRSAMGLANSKVIIRRNGQLTTVPVGRLERAFDFGNGDQRGVAVTWPEVLTAYHSTGIRNIETYIEANITSWALYQFAAGIVDTLQLEAIQRLLSIGVGAWPEGPSATQREMERCVIVAEAEDSWRRTSCARLETADGYSFTAESATTIASRVLEGRFQPGFQTPAKLYGADFVLTIVGSRREDLKRPFPSMPSDKICC